MKNFGSPSVDKSTWLQLTSKMKDAEKHHFSENSGLLEQVEDIIKPNKLKVSLPKSKPASSLFKAKV